MMCLVWQRLSFALRDGVDVLVLDVSRLPPLVAVCFILVVRCQRATVSAHSSAWVAMLVNYALLFGRCFRVMIYAGSAIMRTSAMAGLYYDVAKPMVSVCNDYCRFCIFLVEPVDLG